MIGLLTPKRMIILGLIFAIGVLFYLYSDQLYKAGENACMALVSEKTIETNNQSRKNADAVKKDEQSRSKRDVIDGLCGLGIMYENRGCSE